MPRMSEQIEWLSLVDISGPFIAPSVLEQVFPQGLDKIETPRRQRIRSAYEEWRDAVDEDDIQLSEIHAAWVQMVLQDLLEYEDSVLVSRDDLEGKCVYSAPEHGVVYLPDYVVHGDDGKLRMLISFWPPETDLEKSISGESWSASPLERMTLLCRSNEVRIGLVTDGERWMVVNAPIGGTSGYVAWLARLWWQEPLTLKSFQSLLGVRRSFGPKEDTLESLLERSSEFQEEVTVTLGEQVRRAVEILIQAIERADHDRNGELLIDVKPSELYEAGLTIMMRLVFTLCAEERGLLLLGNSGYDQNYAISTLRAKLREDADRYGVEVLERNNDAWSRILTVFRIIYAGVDHESLRLPALGGSLFDPDRFPFLEGRAKNTQWLSSSATPLPIDNRTVLLLLDALQVLEQRGGAQLLSYRALDVEQIGHVYEGLLEYTVAKLDQATIGLVGSSKNRFPSIMLNNLEELYSQGREKLIEFLGELTGRSSATIGKALTKVVDYNVQVRLIHACGGDEIMANRLLPFADLIRSDSWGTMLVYKAGSFAVVAGSSRRSTGTHYTPKALTEPIVQHTLEPLVYIGPSEGLPKTEWKLKSPNELIALKICDMSMGSGAFLVQACRYLSERLIESWVMEEQKGKVISIDGQVLDLLQDYEPLPKLLEDRILIGRRLIASRCLYGVDINPLAVELGKLSLWLITMMKDRPFGFLDHALKCGDSLLGVKNVKQIENFSLRPGEWQITYASDIFSRAVEFAGGKRTELEELPSNDNTQIENKNRLHYEVEKAITKVKAIADLLIAFELNGFDDKIYDMQRMRSAEQVQQLIQHDSQVGIETIHPDSLLARVSHQNLHGRHPFHWPLEYPEVFIRGGFDAFIGNPPYLHGRRISTIWGDEYLRYLCTFHDKVNGSADLVAYFVLRGFTLIRDQGCFGIVTTQGIFQGDTRETGLDYILRSGGFIYDATSDFPWPGTAAVRVCRFVLWKSKKPVKAYLDGKEIEAINASLEASEYGKDENFRTLRSNANLASTGTYVYGSGFVLTKVEAEQFIRINPKCKKLIFPFLRGEDINGHPQQHPEKMVINFGEMNEIDARIYEPLYSHLEKTVKPERDKQTKQIHEDCFWKHWDKRPDLYAKLNVLPECLVHAFTSKYVAFAFVSTKQIIATPHVIFPTGSRSLFACLQSSIHVFWVELKSTKMDKRIRYTPSDCVQKYPLPFEFEPLNRIGKKYYDYRAKIMLTCNIGLTDFYNRFHDRNNIDIEIAQIRTLQEELDHEVVLAYGWSDLKLKYGFYDTKQGIRYTFSDAERRIVLDRLLQLNHQRYEEEQKAGLHDSKKKSPKAKGLIKNRKSHQQENDLFQ